MPGKQAMGLGMTIVLGVIGAIVDGFIGGLLGGDGVSGILDNPWSIGTILLGIVAIVWLIDSMIGFVLTLPRGWTAGGWARSWAKSWRIKRHASATRRVYDLHRSGGLWTWTLLALIAGTSVALTLEHEVVEPAVSV